MATKPTLLPRRTQLPVQGFWRQNDKIEQFDAILRQHDLGVFNQSARLVDEIMTDDRIMGVVQTRQGGLLSAPFKVDANGDKKLHKKLAEEIGGNDQKSGIWEEIVTPAVAASMLEWGWFLGVAVGRIEWNNKPTRHMPRLTVWHPANVRWDDALLRFVINAREDSRIVLPNIDEETRSDGEWVVWCPFGFGIHGCRRGLVRALALKYLSRNWTERDWDRFNELRAMGLIKALVPPNAQEDGDSFFEDVARMGSEPYVKVPQGQGDVPGYDVQAVEFGTTGTMWQSLNGRKADLNTDIAVLVLGQEMTTQASAAGLGSSQAQEQGKVRIDKALQDAGIAGCFRMQVLTHMIERNYVDPRNSDPVDLTPKICYEVAPPDDEKGEAEALKTLGEAGQALLLADPQVDVPTIFESMGVPRLSDEEFAAQQEAEAEAAPPAPAAPVPGDGGGGDGGGGGGGGDAEGEGGAPPGQPQKLSGKLEQVFGRYQVCGLPIAVENPRGSIRAWRDAEGLSGYTRMHHDYGFIEGYLGTDKEELDCYVGPVKDPEDVYVVHQRGPLPSGRWGHDEDKVFLGFASADEAKAAFLAHRNDGERAYGGMKVMPVEQFKAKLRRRGSGATTRLTAASVAATTRSLMALAGRARTGVTRARTVAGRKRAAKYQERLLSTSMQRAAAALAPFLAGMKDEIDKAGSLEEIRPRVLRYLAARQPPKTLALVVRGMNVLSRVSGQVTAREEV